MKKTIIILIVALLPFSALYGCASGIMTKVLRPPPQLPAITRRREANDNEPGGDPQIERKIIRNASLDMEATDVVTAYESLLVWAAQYGGYETRRNQQRVNDIISIDAQIKIKPEHLDALLDYAKTLGDVINTQISTEDITILIMTSRRACIRWNCRWKAIMATWPKQKQSMKACRSRADQQPDGRN